MNGKRRVDVENLLTYLEESLQPPDLEYTLAQQHSQLENTPPLDTSIGGFGRVSMGALTDDDVGLFIFHLVQKFGEFLDCREHKVESAISTPQNLGESSIHLPFNLKTSIAAAPTGTAKARDHGVYENRADIDVLSFSNGSLGASASGTYTIP